MSPEGEGVSFDLAVWHATAPIRAFQAQATYMKICHALATPDAADPSVVAFLGDLTGMPTRIVGGEPIDDEDDPWEGRVHANEHGAVVHIRPSASRGGGKVMRELAQRHGLVCYDPQKQLIRLSVPGYTSAFTLTTADDDEIPDPSADRIERAARKLSGDNHLVTVKRSDDWFVQAGYGENVGARRGTYAMEYQEGSLDQQYRTETTDLNYVIKFLTEFLKARDTWRRRHTWHRLDL
jgi:hypothetical protein